MTGSFVCRIVNLNARRGRRVDAGTRRDMPIAGSCCEHATAIARLAVSARAVQNSAMTTITPPPLLETLEHSTGPDPAWSVIWLHGLGDSGHGFAPIVPDLIRGRAWPALRFVFPHAPVRPITINGGMAMRAWYDITDLDFDPNRRGDEDGMATSIAQVEALIAHEAGRGVPAQRIVLAGFSQGGAITLATGLRRHAPLAGLLALSTYLPAPDRAQTNLAPAATQQPVFMAHGLYDPVIRYAYGEGSAAVLKGLGFAVAWHPYPIAHTVSDVEIRDIGNWLDTVFAAG
jgi:phospholipase/carboxylesterase